MNPESIIAMQEFVEIKLKRIQHVQEGIDKLLSDGSDADIFELLRDAYESPYYDVLVLLTVLSVEAPSTFQNDFQSLFD